MIGDRIHAETLPDPCPFCGGEVAADVDSLSLIHSMPPCETFVRLDILDFAIAMRRALGYAEPDDN
jgi:hypothetical protein